MASRVVVSSFLIKRRAARVNTTVFTQSSLRNPSAHSTYLSFG
jgi:hypothetical protein